MKQYNKFEVCSFTGFGEDMPNLLGSRDVATPLSELLYFLLIGRAKAKVRTKFDVCSFSGFGDMLEGMPNFIGVT